jgi:DNA modification methylase
MAISDHPCLKPQHFMRIIVRALLPLGEGTLLDPFMGSGSTIAAAEAVGYRSVGIEIDKDYFHLAEASIPKLAALNPTLEGAKPEFDSSDYPQIAVEESQLTMALAEWPGRYRMRKS